MIQKNVRLRENNGNKYKQNYLNRKKKLFVMLMFTRGERASDGETYGFYVNLQMALCSPIW